MPNISCNILNTQNHANYDSDKGVIDNIYIF